MFENYSEHDYQTDEVNIHYRIGGKGPALLLLHGHPQTHVIWHKVADELAQHFTVVASDLRGYGDSDKPPASASHERYSKRVMAQDQLALMQSLGFDRFIIMAHDRGARVAHRLAVDHPKSVERMILLDIAPTLAMYQQTTEDFARIYWHWFFLIRPTPFPEKFISHDPQSYLDATIGARSVGIKPFDTTALEEYKRCLQLPGTATGICEDYRASASIDLEHDKDDIKAGRKVTCPILVLWGKDGAIEKCFNALEEWNKVAINVKGEAMDCGHYIPEEAPELLMQYTREFLTC